MVDQIPLSNVREKRKPFLGNQLGIACYFKDYTYIAFDNPSNHFRWRLGLGLTDFCASLACQKRTNILLRLGLILHLFPPDPSNWFGLFSVLALSDFCQIWLLLFPNVVRISNITSISNVSTTNVPSCQRSQGPNPPRDSNVLA
ncbi:hypothetical protein BDEG_27027 [Batrachochytrium dendrobatidis JEL423]|uniref:Uncharacterized protein n=1 Tax=Batrachochytrium dendrobatidis (strain JEL423) TaxID=403673 RepID=A0A177WVN8_BATDL|nr:hypothetical protein BDEG_27027 [Batrachochytrium dendrobatidis JEL423]